MTSDFVFVDRLINVFMFGTLFYVIRSFFPSSGFVRSIQMLPHLILLRNLKNFFPSFGCLMIGA